MFLVDFCVAYEGSSLTFALHTPSQWLNQSASALVNSVACAPPWFLILLVVRATAIA